MRKFQNDGHLQAELLEVKAKVHRLRDSMSLGVPTLHKYLPGSTGAKIGQESTVSLEEFFLQALRVLHA